MRIRSTEELSECLSEELSWRKRELTTIGFMLQKQRHHERRLLLRSALCLLYAHWEGFVKVAAKSYLGLVANQGLKYAELSPNFVAFGLRKEIVEAGQSRQPTTHTSLVRKFLLELSELADMRGDIPVATNGNLKMDTLREICCLLGLDDKDYLLKRQLIDQKLLKNRNRIAHGERIFLQLHDYSELQAEVIELLEHFRTDVENAAVVEKFRR